MSKSRHHDERPDVKLLGEILHELRAIRRELQPKPPLPASISFAQQGDPMLPPVAGNTLVYTGTLQPAGSQYPADVEVALVSSDPTVTLTIDPTGLIVTIPLPSTFVDPPAAPFNVGYTATSPSNPGWSVTGNITPSAPAVLPTRITFVQTT